jgi:hypothetical protein
VTIELQIHTTVVEHLQLRGKRDVLWLHPANGEWRNKITGAKLRRMGLLAGASDLLLWHDGKSFALELKAPGGRLTEAQKLFFARFADAGGHTAVGEGVDGALASLAGWGLLR